MKMSKDFELLGYLLKSVERNVDPRAFAMYKDGNITIAFVSPGFTSSFTLATSPRYIPYQPNIGNWAVSSDFTGNVTRLATNNPLPQPIFITPTFSFSSLVSTLNISILNGIGVVINSFTSSLNSDGLESGSGFTITKQGLVQQGSMWAIRTSGTVQLTQALPDGGRFSLRLTLQDGSSTITNTPPIQWNTQSQSNSQRSSIT